MKNEVQITIEDHGIGIPQEDLPYVFDRFYRIDKARNREIAGTGLGLSIAKQFVHNYKGEMSITSEVNVGTTVSIKLPIDPLLKVVFSFSSHLHPVKSLSNAIDLAFKNKKRMMNMSFSRLDYHWFQLINQLGNSLPILNPLMR